MNNQNNPSEAIIEIGKSLYEKGLIVGGDGNISCRTDDDGFLCTPSGLCKGRMVQDDLIVVDGRGNKLSGSLNPSSELKMHLMVYNQRPDVRAVVHAHPPFATAFACCDEALITPLISEVILTIGCIPVAEYGTPSTDQVADSIKELIKEHNGLLLANHGALTVGMSLEEAYYRMETLEHFAKITYLARMIGSEKPISPAKVDELMQVAGKKGMELPKCQMGECQDS